jgi:hypothetical protein
MTKAALHDNARRDRRFLVMTVSSRLRMHPMTTVVVFAIICAFIFRLRGGGFGVNDWKPFAIHSRFIAWLPQVLLYIFTVRCFAHRTRHDGLWLGVLWLFAVLPGWGAWFDVGTFPGSLEDGHEIDWIDRLLDLGFGPLANYMGQLREAWRDAAGLAFRGIYFWPLVFFAARSKGWSFEWKRVLCWCCLWTVLYPLCYAVGHRWWLAGPSPEFYVGFILGLAAFPATDPPRNAADDEV